MQQKLGDRYTLLQRIEYGGMAAIYLARDERLLRPVAVKIIRDYDSAGSLFFFHREARAIAALQHHNIVNILDYSGPDEFPAYIVMEFIRGYNVGQLLYRLGPWPQAAIMAMLRGLAAAIQHAHAAGIVHRDIKPANVMVDPNGRVVLTDFGLAKSFKTEDLLGKTTVGWPTQLSGTPDFLAPEQVLRGPCNEKVDIFTTGVLLYTLATGDLPFHRVDEVETMKAIAGLDYQPLSAEMGGFDKTFLTIVDRCLQYHPQDRPGAEWLYNQADHWLLKHGWAPERLLKDYQQQRFPREAMLLSGP